jgi:D-threo-aldose 1-dehydrogenase
MAPNLAARLTPIRDTGVEISTAGVGGGPIGNLFAPVTDADADLLLHAALRYGIRYFDTAPQYGLGLAETRLGRVLSQQPRDAFVVSTKVGRLLRPDAPPDPDLFHMGEPFFKVSTALNPVWDFSRAGVHQSIEESLDRLSLDRVEIAFLHEPPGRFLRQAVTEGCSSLRDLRRAGVVRAIGIGWDRVDEMASLVEEVDLDCILVAGRYTLLDQSAMQRLLPACARRRVAVIVGGVFNSGILADPDATYEYVPAEPEVRERVRMLTEICRRWSVPLKALALQFPLGHPAVAGIVLGMRSTRELEENLGLLELPMPHGLWREIHNAGLLAEEAPVPGEPNF